MHYEIRSQDASSSDPPTMGSTVTRWLPKKDRVPAYGARRASGLTSQARTRDARRGGHCHICKPATTTFASPVRMRTGRGTTSAADTKPIWDAASYPLRGSPDTPTGRCCNTDPTEHPGSGPSQNG
jgi:hypothetical protein